MQQPSTSINRARQRGFTLIELTVVLVILGILAVTALPKYLNFASDARIESIKQLEVSTQTANGFVNLKAQMPSFSSVDGSADGRITDVDINGDGNHDLRLIWGYLDNEDIAEMVDFSDEFLMMCEGTCKGGAGVNLPGVNRTYIGFDRNQDNDVRNDDCYFEYTQAQAADQPPNYQLFSDGC